MIKELPERRGCGPDFWQTMKPKRPENEKAQVEMWRTRLETFLDPRHPLMQLGKRIDWKFFEKAYSDGFGERGPYALSVRLVVGLSYLKHAENLSDESLLERWVENPYWQHFCGFETFQTKPPCDPTSLTKWRNRLGEEGAKKLLQETLRMATEEGLLRPRQLLEVVVDTTAQEKNIAFPTDAKLLSTARRKLVECATDEGLVLRQSYARVSKHLLFKYSRYSHARQCKRANKVIKRLRTILGRVMRDIRRKVDATMHPMSERMKTFLSLAMRVHTQVKDKHSKNKVYSLHEPHVACIAKGKAHKPYEFGSKVSVTTTAEGAWVVGIENFTGNPYDGATLKEVIADVEQMSGARVRTAFVDKGYRGTVHWPEHVSVIVSGRKRLSSRQARLLKRRQAIEPVIGHMKHDHRLDRNFLKGIVGDAVNAVLAAAAFNFRKLLRFFRLLFVFWFCGLCATLRSSELSSA